MKQDYAIIAVDDSAISESLKIRLEELGLYVDIAPDALSAALMAELSVPSLVIIDDQVLCESGISIAQIVEDHKHLGCVPTILIASRIENDSSGVHLPTVCRIPSGSNLWGRMLPHIETLLDGLSKSNLVF